MNEKALPKTAMSFSLEERKYFKRKEWNKIKKKMPQGIGSKYKKKT
ncbi:hypothetical protein [uncultured Dubosiella sp.]|nr:hypothetical protein [uncultured Dubosiella sp.]